MAAAGNGGRNSEGRMLRRRDGAGNAPWVLTVGASNHHGHERCRGRHRRGVQLARSGARLPTTPSRISSRPASASSR